MNKKFSERAEDMLGVIEFNVIKSAMAAHAHSLQKLRYETARLQDYQEKGIDSISDAVELHVMLKWLGQEIATTAEELGRHIDRHRYMREAADYVLQSE